MSAYTYEVKAGAVQRLGKVADLRRVRHGARAETATEFHDYLSCTRVG